MHYNCHYNIKEFKNLKYAEINDSFIRIKLSLHDIISDYFGFAKDGKVIKMPYTLSEKNHKVLYIIGDYNIKEDYTTQKEALKHSIEYIIYEKYTNTVKEDDKCLNLN